MTIIRVGSLPVSALAGDVVACVDPDANLWELSQALAEADVGALGVGDRDDVRGVVSERDVVRALAVGRDPSTTTAKDVAHTRLVWCDANSTVAEVAEEMMDRYVRHVLIEEAGCVIGIVSARDLLGAYAAAEFAED
jgi:CBS domain-containing protein